MDNNSSAYVPADAYQINAHMVAIVLTVIIVAVWLLLIFIRRKSKFTHCTGFVYNNSVLMNIRNRKINTVLPEKRKDESQYR